MKLSSIFFLPKNKKHYFFTVILLLGLLVSVIFLLPQIRQFVCTIIEQLVLHRKLQNPEKWKYKLFECALISSGFMLMLNFLLLTQLGRKLINKTEAGSKTNDFFNKIWLMNTLSSNEFFLGFALLNGIIVFTIAIFRAANTNIMYDEAFTYLYYVLPNIFDSFTENQALNNHLLNSFCIRVIMFFSQSKYNELLIRFPNLFFYWIYIIFSYLIARKNKNKFFIFILFIYNYYINEYFGLARGYGIACACMTGVCYYYEKWKYLYINKKNDRMSFSLFLFFCTLSVLSNSITLYIIFCFFILIIFKYNKNILSLPNLFIFIIFILTGLHTIEASKKAVYSTYNILSTVMSIPNTFTDQVYLGLLIALVFFLSFGWLIIKTKAKDDYCWILAIFIVICIVSNIVFRRGYPVTREMIPFYPIFVVIIINTLKYFLNHKIIKPILVVCTVLLVFQFFAKYDVKRIGTDTDYLIRDNIYNYIISHDVSNNKKEFMSYIDTCQEQSYWNPVYIFYANKVLLNNNSGE